MNKIRIELSEEENLNEIEADFLVLKNLEDGLFGPEKFINSLINDKLRTLNSSYYSTEDKIICLENEYKNLQSKHIILTGIGNFEGLSLQKVRRFYDNAFSYIIDHQFSKNNVKVLTVIHGIGLGFEKKDIFDQLIKSIHKTVLSVRDKNNIESIILNENGEFGRAKIKSFLVELKLLNPDLVAFENEAIFLNLKPSLKNSIQADFEEKFRDAISKDNLTFAFDLLENNSQLSSTFGKEIVLYKNWFKALKEADLNGTISFEEKFIRKNRLLMNLLTILDEYKF